MIEKWLSSKLNAFVLLILVSFVLYFNTLSHQYALDDAIVITDNSFVKQGFDGIDEILTTELFTGFFGVKKNLVEGGRFRPLSLISFAIEYELFGLNPAISHFLNILLYALTAIVLYQLMLLILKQKVMGNPLHLVAMSIAMLWLVHPLHTEVVANIKGRDEIFTLLGALLSVKYLWLFFEKNNKWYYLASLFAFFLALLSKEMAITFVLIIPLTFHFFSNIDTKKWLVPILGFAIPTIIFLLMRQSIMGEPAQTGASVPQELMNDSFLGTTINQKWATIILTLSWYLKLLWIPYPLTFDYYPYHVSLTTFTNPLVIGSIIIHLALLFWAIKGWKQKSVWSYAILFYALSFSIVSNVLFPIGTFMSERFMFMPSIGWAIGMIWALHWLMSQPKTWAKPLTYMLVILVILPFGAQTVARNQAWANDYMLFTTDVLTSKGSAKSNTSAGGKMIEEVEKFEKVLRESPKNFKLMAETIESSNLRDADKQALLEGGINANLKLKLEQFNHQHLAQALAYLEKAVEIHPTYVDALLLLGNAHYKYNKNFDGTWQAYEKILIKNPSHKLVEQNWTLILSDSLDMKQKIQFYKKYLKYNPRHFESYYQIGNIYGRGLNQLDSAIVYLEYAKAINPNNSKVFKDLGVAYGMSKMYEKALPAMQRAYALDPNDKQIALNIGVTYQMIGKIDSAQYYFKLGAPTQNP